MLTAREIGERDRQEREREKRERASERELWVGSRCILRLYEAFNLVPSFHSTATLRSFMCYVSAEQHVDTYIHTYMQGAL